MATQVVNCKCNTVLKKEVCCIFCAIHIILIYQVEHRGFNGFYPSVDDPEKYIRIIQPWFLNALNKMSASNTWMKVRKIDVFDKASKVHLVGFKGNKEELEKYSENKDSKDYLD